MSLMNKMKELTRVDEIEDVIVHPQKSIHFVHMCFTEAYIKGYGTAVH